MHKQFNQFKSEDELRDVLKNFVPGDVSFVPVVESDGSLTGIVEPHDLLRTESPDHHFRMREIARRDFVLAFPGELIDQVHRDMMLKNTENVVVVKPGTRVPIGIARANDILQLLPLADGGRDAGEANDARKEGGGFRIFDIALGQRVLRLRTLSDQRKRNLPEESKSRPSRESATKLAKRPGPGSLSMVARKLSRL